MIWQTISPNKPCAQYGARVKSHLAKFFMSMFLLPQIYLFSAESMPAWVLSPPKNDSAFLYGVGEGSSIKEARDEALNEIASNIIVSIQSTYKKNESLNQINNANSYRVDVQNDIKSEVKKIEFNNVEIVSNGFFNSKSYVLLRIDKVSLAREKQTLLESNQKEMSQKFINLSRKDIIYQLKEMQSVVKLANESIELSNIISVLDDKIDNRAKIVEFRNYKQFYDSLINRLEFVIISDSNSILFANSFKEALTSEKIKLADRPSKNSIVLNISSLPIMNYIYSTYMVKTVLTIALLSRDNKVVTTMSKELSGNSRLNYNSAIGNASAQLLEDVKKIGVFSFLGFE
jgi:LPP20 lipoprotein